MSIVNQIGIFSKLCVAVFVFVSGYGLAVSTPKEIKLKDFYLHRFKKLYLNYWFIWLLFVPIGVFVFGRTFMDAYGEYAAIKAILDFFGLLNLTGMLGYNPTWWFYSCIFVLYLLFPLLNKQFDKSPYLILVLSIFTVFIGFVPFIAPYSHYLLPFIAGMLMAKRPELFREIGAKECLLSLAILCLMRNFCGDLKFIVDTLMCVGLAMFLYRVPLAKRLSMVMESLGKHSMNIFLFHTFIFRYWFSDYIYITRKPLLIFLSLLIPCWLISVALEFSKEKLGFYKL